MKDISKIVKGYHEVAGDIYYIDEDGGYHREDGPALIYTNGSEYWFKHDKYHRLDGPAVSIVLGDDDGTIVKYWFVNDIDITKEIKEWAKLYNIDLDNLSDEDKFLIKLHWENYHG